MKCTQKLLPNSHSTRADRTMQASAVALTTMSGQSPLVTVQLVVILREVTVKLAVIEAGAGMETRKSQSITNS